MDEQERHVMNYLGDDEWFCPICHRHLRLTFPPNYSKIVLYVGNEFVSHCGGMGGVIIKNVEISDPHLDFWNDALDKLEF